MNRPAHTYRQFSVQGATPLGLVVMLYDGAIAALQRAVNAVEAHDIPKKCTHLSRALAIITQLEGSLNFELGGKAAQTLKTLYTYSRAQAMKANMENSPEILRSLIENFSTVRDAWNQADRPPLPSPTMPSDKGPSPPPGPAASLGSWRLSG